MFRNGRLQVTFALALGFIAALLVWNYTRQLQEQLRLAKSQAAQSPVEQVEVLVAATDVPARTKLTPDLVKVIQLPRDAKLPLALTHVDEVTNKYARYPLAAGEQILPSKVATDDTVPSLSYAVPTGKRAMAITFSELIGSGGLIHPGDKVDVVAYFESQGFGLTPSPDIATVLLQNVEVLAVAQSYEHEQGTETAGSLLPRTTGLPNNAPLVPASGSSTPAATPGPAKPQDHPEAKSITLAVTPEQAEKLLLAEVKGHVRLALRPVDDDTVLAVPEVSFLDLVPPAPASTPQPALTPSTPTAVASPTPSSAAPPSSSPLQITNVKIAPTNLKPGETLRVEITAKNVSKEVVKTQGPDPEYIYVQGQTFYSQKFPSQAGRYRVGINFEGRSSVPYPYRWGLGGDLQPGASTTVVGLIKMTYDIKATTFWAGVIQEPETILVDNQAPTLVTVLPSSIAVITVGTAHVRSGPDLASMIVADLTYGTQVPILGQENDWFKVKLADGRIGYVAAGWISLASGSGPPAADVGAGSSVATSFTRSDSSAVITTSSVRR